MQSVTRTQFKQKTCPKCRNNHDLDGVLCSLCVAKAEAALAKRPPIPDSFWIKCLVVREGDSIFNLGNMQYTFRRNERGDAVCEVINQGHYYQILKSDFFIPYVPEDAVETKAEAEIPKADNKPSPFNSEQEIIIDVMYAQGSKSGEIAKVLSEGLTDPIPYQRVMKFIAEKYPKE